MAHLNVTKRFTVSSFSFVLIRSAQCLNDASGGKLLHKQRLATECLSYQDKTVSYDTGAVFCTQRSDAHNYAATSKKVRMSYWTREGCFACVRASCTQRLTEHRDVITSCIAAKLCSGVLAVYIEKKEFNLLLKK